MSRIIKFRAKKDDISDSSFVYGDLIYTQDGYPRILVDKERLLFATCLKNTEGEFTGLFDKNGKEVFEGDIVRITNRLEGEIGRGPVVYNNAIARFGVKLDDGDPWGIFNGNNCNEVLGNLHENPSLLEKGE